MDTLIQDVRYALRQLRRDPAFSAVAVGTLAVGIGATAAIFSVARAVLFRPLPVPEPERLVMVWESHPEWSDRNLVSSGSFMDWRDEAESFEDLEAYGGTYGLTLQTGGAPERITARWVTPGLFPTLGAGAAVGRTFLREDPGRESEVVLSHGFWQRRFGGDPGIVGRRVSLNEEPVTVVGVLGRGFSFPSVEAEMWLPLRLDEEDRQARRSHRWRVLGRLAPGVTLAGARSEMEVLAARLRDRHPEFMAGWDVRVIPHRADLVREVRPLVLVLLGFVGVVLLVSCANVGNLLLARATARTREMAVRGSIGAGRGRLLRQVLTESLVLAALGGGAGVLLAWLGVDLLVILAPPDIPLVDATRLDTSVLAVAAAITLGSAVLLGLVPAARAGAVDLRSGLRTGAAGGGRRSRLRRAVLIAEIALACLLLAGAGLLVRSALELRAVDPGFETSGLLSVSLDLPGSRYPETADHVRFYSGLLERVRSLSGVADAAGTAEPPIVGFANTFSYLVEGRRPAGPDPREDPVEVRVVSPDYFRTMRIPLLDGRTLDERDRADAARAVVVNESLADEHWPRGGAVGRRITFEDEGGGPWWTVVGVVGDTRGEGVERPAEPAMYMSLEQKRWSWMSWLTLMVRAEDDPRALAGTIRAAVADADRMLPVHRMVTVEELYAESEARRRFATSLLVGFAVLALVLAAVGVYGVVSYDIVRRRREIGIRIALGAARRTVVAAAVADALRLAAAGVVLGVGGALVLAGLMEGLLYGVPPRDPWTLAAAALVLAATAAAASAVPAGRAARLRPSAVLQAE